MSTPIYFDLKPCMMVRHYLVYDCACMLINFMVLYTVTNEEIKFFYSISFILISKIDKQCIWLALATWCCINSWRPNDTIWWHRSGSTSAQVMGWCLTTPSHDLTQCQRIISGFSNNNLREILQEIPQPLITKFSLKITIQVKSPMGQLVKMVFVGSRFLTYSPSVKHHCQSIKSHARKLHWLTSILSLNFVRTPVSTSAFSCSIWAAVVTRW